MGCQPGKLLQNPTKKQRKKRRTSRHRRRRRESSRDEHQSQDERSNVDQISLKQSITFPSKRKRLTETNDNTSEDISGVSLVFNDSFNIDISDPEAYNKPFIQQRQQAIDNTTYQSRIKSWRPKSLDQLAYLIENYSKGKSIIDRHWIIFYWIVLNIEYDTESYFSKNYKDQTAEGVFQNRKGVCAGYGNLYKYLCDQVELPCEIVSGFSKGYGFDDRDREVPVETDHAWNAVEIYDHWYLIESTWGAGYLDDKKAFVRKLSTYYFLPRPNEMIFHHLPEKQEWQLLQSPIDMTKFLEMPHLRPLFFQYNLEMIQPRYQCFVNLEENKPYALVIIKTPDKISLLANLKLNDTTVEGGHQALFNKKQRLYFCYFAPSRIGKHKAMIYAKYGETDTGEHSCVLDLTLNIIDLPKNPISYPTFWKIFHDYRMKIHSPLNTHIINVNNKRKYAEINLRVPFDVMLIGKLTNRKEESVMCGQQVYYDKEKRLWRCLFAPNKNGIFTALILAKKKSDSGLYKSAISFKINAKGISSPFLSFPNTWDVFHDSDLKILSPVGKGIISIDDRMPYAEVCIKAPNQIRLLSKLYNDKGETIEGGAQTKYDAEKDCWKCRFAPNQNGLFECHILTNKLSDADHYTSAVSFKLNAERVSSQAISLPKTTALFDEFNLEILPPNNCYKIILEEISNFVEICLKAPNDVEILGQLQNSKEEQEIPYTNQVYYDRHKDIWRCKFAPNAKGMFNAIIMARKKSDSGPYSGVVTFLIEANYVPKPQITYPTTWQAFFDYDLKVKVPRSSAFPKWSDNSLYAEILIEAPDDVHLSSSIKFNHKEIENGSLAQYDHYRRLWQLLFVPERTGFHDLIVFAKQINNKDESAHSAVMFRWNVTNIKQVMKFPLIYTQFHRTKCQIYTPLYGILEKNSSALIHCRIPGAQSVMITTESKPVRGGSYKDSVYQNEITVGSEEVTVNAKYDQNPHYTTLIKYFVQ